MLVVHYLVKGEIGVDAGVEGPAKTAHFNKSS